MTNCFDQQALLRALACTAALLGIGGVAAGQRGPEAPDSAVVQALEMLLSSDVDDLWPGYSGPREFILCPTAGGALLALQAPPTSLPVVRLETQGPSGAVLYYSAQRPASVANCIRPLGVDFEGKRVLAFPQIDSVYSLKDPLLAVGAVLVHEAFHKFQFRHFSTGTGETGPAVLDEPPATPVNVVTSDNFSNLAARERALLAAALRSADVSAIPPLVREYLCVRADRMALVPERVVPGEAFNEGKEGTAHYVATRWAAAKSAGTFSAADLIVVDLESTPDLREHPSALRNWHGYAVGAALGLLLDRLGVEWKEQLGRGATFQDLVAKAAMHRGCPSN